jgi:hypothetical protein
MKAILALLLLVTCVSVFAREPLRPFYGKGYYPAHPAGPPTHGPLNPGRPAVTPPYIKAYPTYPLYPYRCDPPYPAGPRCY